MKSVHLLTRTLLVTFVALGLLFAIFSVARYVTDSDQAQELVANFGYIGVVIIAFIAGLNAIVPVPAGSFVPIFTAAGLWLPLIITMMVIGTMLADLLAYAFGRFGRGLALDKYPSLVARVQHFREERTAWVIPGVFLYAALAPFPNELILVPLALTGMRLQVLLPPLLLGTILYQTAFAFGIQTVFDLFVGL